MYEGTRGKKACNKTAQSVCVRAREETLIKLLCLKLKKGNVEDWVTW